MNTVPNFTRVKAVVAALERGEKPADITEPQVDMSRVKRAVSNLEGGQETSRRRCTRHLTPVDVGRRKHMKAKGDDHLFVGILTGGVMCHD